MSTKLTTKVSLTVCPFTRLWFNCPLLFEAYWIRPIGLRRISAVNLLTPQDFSQPLLCFIALPFTGCFFFGLINKLIVIFGPMQALQWRHCCGCCEAPLQRRKHAWGRLPPVAAASSQFLLCRDPACKSCCQTTSVSTIVFAPRQVSLHVSKNNNHYCSKLFRLDPKRLLTVFFRIKMEWKLDHYLFILSSSCCVSKLHSAHYFNVCQNLDVAQRRHAAILCMSEIYRFWFEIRTPLLSLIWTVSTGANTSSLSEKYTLPG